MKKLFILLLLVLKSCDGEKIVKRFVEQNSTTGDSFQVNVSAGYGVHSENVTTLPSPVYKPQERKIKENNTDQLMEESQKIKDSVALPTYQVHEKSSDIQDKHFQVSKVRHRPEKRLRQRNKIEEHKEAKLTAGTKIVEVLRVPAMYELHLQSDPQRLAALNTAWLTKLIGQNQRRHPEAQASVVSYATAAPTPAPYQRLGNSYQMKMRYLSQKFAGHNQQYPSSYAVSPLKLIPHQPQVQSFGGYKYHARPQSSFYNSQNSLTHAESIKKPIIETSTLASSYQLSNEITDIYQKPQALHEVPAPVLDKHPKYGTSTKIKPVGFIKPTVPSLVYGKPVDPPYQPSTQAPAPMVNLWNPHQSWGQISSTTEPVHDYYSNNQVNAYYQAPEVPTQHHHQHQHQHQHQQQQQQYQSQDIFNSPSYQGYKNVQNYYNDAIGGHLDQNLVNVNGGVATFVNPEGTMTISNFHHNPKLYKPPPGEYEITENPEDVPQDYFNPYSQSLEFPENQLETAEQPTNPYQSSSDLANLLLNSRPTESPRFEPISGYGRRQMARRMYGKRRVEPMDYILYIKEKRLD